jgi:peptidyl-prolyl cis-trans isomerase A (cyclophilin A)
MKTNLKLILLVFLSISNIYAQKSKKGTQKPKVATTKNNVAAANSSNKATGMFAEFDTSKGKIVVQLEYTKTPLTVANFVSLVEGTNTAVADKFKGKPYYNGLKFHRVIKDFMIQGGDPDGNGSGGPGYKFKDEITDLKHSRAGTLSMANSGAGTNTNGSQFFITHKDTPWLDTKHTVFGYVTSGQDVVNKIEQNDVINKVTITKNSADAKAFNASKIFADYYAGKGDEDKKMAAEQAEKAAKIAAEKAVKDAEYNAKYAPIKAVKVASLATVKAVATKTDSGLVYKITKPGTGKKPADGTTVYIYYAGYFEDGSLFDSNYEAVSQEYGKYDVNRATQKGYDPFPFQYGKKDGLIPGFLEGLNAMSMGDKTTLFIPSNLGYGAAGAGGVIPPNSNLIFELEMVEAIPAAKK